MSERNFNSCPFCGSSSISLTSDNGYSLQAQCDDCSTKGPKCSSGASCEEHWNTRAAHIGCFVSSNSVISELQGSIEFLNRVIDKLKAE